MWMDCVFHPGIDYKISFVFLFSKVKESIQNDLVLQEVFKIKVKNIQNIALFVPQSIITTSNR